MSRCSICRDGRVGEIDAALLAGQSLRDVAARFSLAKSSVSRHVPHVRQAVHTAQATSGPVRVLDVAKILTAINSACLDVLHDARRGRDPRIQLQASSTILRQLEFSEAMGQAAEQQELLVRVEHLEAALAARTNGTVERQSWSSVV